MHSKPFNSIVQHQNFDESKLTNITLQVLIHVLLLANKYSPLELSSLK
jgi:hypothetical protein